MEREQHTQAAEVNYHLDQIEAWIRQNHPGDPMPPEIATLRELYREDH